MTKGSKMDKDIRKKLGAIDLSKRFKKLSKYCVSTGIIAFDRVIGGGIPSGRLTEFYGGESTAKSRLVNHILAETQKVGGVGILVDTERALDEGLIALTGVDPEKLIYPDPEKIETIEDVFNLLDEAIKAIRPQYSDAPITFVWDSVAATPGMEDMEKEIGRNEASMRRAKIIGDGLRKFIPLVYKNQICLVFVNQIRDKINVMYGDQTDTPGGRAIKFWASLRLGMKITGKIKDETTKEQIGTKLELFVRKSKVSKPFGVVNFEMYVDEPISPYAGLLDYMKRHGEVKYLGAGKYCFVGNEKETFTKAEFSKAYEKRQKGDK